MIFSQIIKALPTCAIPMIPERKELKVQALARVLNQRSSLNEHLLVLPQFRNTMQVTLQQ